jgi:carboxylesterase type B
MKSSTSLGVLLLGRTFAQHVTAGPIVRLAQGGISYHGTRIGSVEHFQNIKFAHDTSGPRRFSPPVPYIPPSGAEIDASTEGAACPQTRDGMPPFFAETTNMNEDCLNLRIARHEGTTSNGSLPVVIWVHGGGVVKGSAYDPHFEPDKLIAHSHKMKSPVIFVALNYRLTIFGFARLPPLQAESSLNVGMRDQRAGFQWVKDHIKDFGGDPDRITVFGLSAGGTFASLHLMAFGGEQGVPFNQVWSMSGPPGTALNMSSTVTEYHTTTVASIVGCSQDKDLEKLQCLRDVPMEVLLSAAMQYSVSNHPPAGLFTFIPSVDGDMFPATPSKLYKAGRFVKGQYDTM